MRFDFDDGFPVGNFPIYGFPDGKGKPARSNQPVPLSNGLYWFDGDATGKLALTGQGWVAWNGTDDIVSSADYLSILEVSADKTLTAWDTTSGYIGRLDGIFYEGTFATYTAILPDGFPPSVHGSWSVEVYAATFSGTSSKPVHMAVFDQSIATPVLEIHDTTLTP